MQSLRLKRKKTKRLLLGGGKDLQNREVWRGVGRLLRIKKANSKGKEKLDNMTDTHQKPSESNTSHSGRGSEGSDKRFRRGQRFKGEGNEGRQRYDGGRWKRGGKKFLNKPQDKLAKKANHREGGGG